MEHHMIFGAKCVQINIFFKSKIKRILLFFSQNGWPFNQIWNIITKRLSKALPEDRNIFESTLRSTNSCFLSNFRRESIQSIHSLHSYRSRQKMNYISHNHMHGSVWIEGMASEDNYSRLNPKWMQSSALIPPHIYRSCRLSEQNERAIVSRSTQTGMRMFSCNKNTEKQKWNKRGPKVEEH